MHTNAEGGSVAAAAVFQAELVELQRDLLRASRHGTSLVSGIDPNRLVNVMRTLSMGFIALAAKATADGARRLGVGIVVGTEEEMYSSQPQFCVGACECACYYVDGLRVLPDRLAVHLRPGERHGQPAFVPHLTWLYGGPPTWGA